MKDGNTQTTGVMSYVSIPAGTIEGVVGIAIPRQDSKFQFQQVRLKAATIGSNRRYKPSFNSSRYD